MTHIEDKVLYGGVKGTREAILALRSLRDTLGGVHDGSVSVKWDGAPAVLLVLIPETVISLLRKRGFSINHRKYIILLRTWMLILLAIWLLS